MRLLQLILSFFFLGALSSWAMAQQAPKKILVSVGDFQENQIDQWKKSTCTRIYNIANQVVAQGVSVTCRSFDTTNFADSGLEQAQKDNIYHLRLTRAQSGAIDIDVHNWHQKNETDFKNLGWKFKDDPLSKTKKEEAITKALANFFFFVANEDAFKAGLLINGAMESESIAYDPKDGVFKDKLTKEPISPAKAYALFEGEGERKKNYLRTGIELGVLLSAGMAIYYRHLVFNQQDFDYGFREGLRKKFNGEAILFDDNDKASNYGHIYAGVLYYQIARANGFSSLESFLVTFASSAAWEFLEYHEVFSLNDQILTPIGGYVIGEATYQISCALLQKGAVGKTIGYALNPGLGLNKALDKRTSNNAYPNQLDCKKPRWSNISMYLGIEQGQKPYEAEKDSTYVIGMNAEVVNINDYNKPGQNSRLVFDTAMVKAMIEKGGGDGMGDLKVIAQIVAAAYNQKNISTDERGQLRGYDVIMGIGSATTWNDRGGQTNSLTEDFYGTINILGATAKANIFYKGMNIQAEFGFYGDFAMVKAWALNDFRESNGGHLNDQFTIIRKRGYYWGLGTTTLAALSVSRGRVKVGYDAQISTARDIPHRHRNQTEANNPASFKDSFIMQRFYVTFQLSKNTSIQVAQEINTREGRANGRSAKRGIEHRTVATLIYLF